MSKFEELKPAPRLMAAFVVASPYSEIAGNQIQSVLDKGKEFLEFLDSLHTPVRYEPMEPGSDISMGFGTFDRELILAKERVEEGIMWAVQHASK